MMWLIFGMKIARSGDEVKDKSKDKGKDEDDESARRLL